MSLTRKEFLELTGRAALGATALSTFDFLFAPRGFAEVLQST